MRVLVLIAAHLAAALAAPLVVRWWGARAFYLLALVPAASFGWLLTQLPAITAGGEVVERVGWISALSLDLDLRIDALGLLMAGIVTGIGALILLYSRWYFAAERDGLGRYTFSFMAFAGSMLGLVVSDNLLLLYVFWELTTIFSYLLIAQHYEHRTSRRAAMQALMVTTFGGLAMLVGFILLGRSAGSYDLSYVAAHPPEGGVAVAVAVLVLLGVLSKSAIVPFHFWLPSAMAAPTPVSAYLHAAAMVKAGIYLVARMNPEFSALPVWRWSLLALGAAGLLLGAWQALRQYDLKLLLAYGTVSQLGFMAFAFGIGTDEAALAGTLLLTAHALYKSTLFLVVGVIDHRTGGRDLRMLSGLGRRAPVLAVVAAAAVGSMIGLPPLLGYVGKEAVYAAELADSLPAGPAPVALAAVTFVGAVLTVAYGVMFWWGGFATWRRGEESGAQAPAPPRPADAAGPAITLVPLLLALLGLLGGLTLPWISSFLAGASGDPTALVELWHGLGLPVLLSVLGWVVGTGVVLLRRRRTFPLLLPEELEAQWRYRRMMRGLDRLAVEITGATQRGSLPFYLGVALSVLGGLLLWAVLRDAWPTRWAVWDSPMQLAVAVVTVIAIVTATRVRQRLAAVLLVGTSGYAMVALFVLHGAPDLALTQALVETCTLVVFVLVLRKLPKQIRIRHTRWQEWRRWLLAAPLGVLVAVGGAFALSRRTATPISSEFPEPVFDFGGGRNIVNVILVDVRAWDTIGEISVLIAAATGVASLVFLRRRTGSPPQLDETLGRRDPISDRTFLRGGLGVAAEHRSVVLELATRVLFPTMIVLSVYLLFAGHNVPGGGFVGGLVAGLALVVRYLAAGRYELGEAAPVDAGLVLGLGLLIAGTTGVAGLVGGGEVLQSTIWAADLPLFGEVKLVSALFFDIGVYLVVVGLILDILRSLGAELDRRDEDDEPELEPVS